MKRIISILFFATIVFSAFSQGSSGNRGTNQAVTIQQANRNTKLYNQTAHGFTNCTLVYFNGTQFAKANANTLATSKVIGIVTNVIDANNFELTTSGYVAGCNTLTTGADYYLSATTAGTYTTTAPALPNQSILVFKAISNNELIIGSLGGSSSNSGWSILGNAGTVQATNFLGTTDNVGLSLRTNNVIRQTIDNVGNVGIGVPAPTAKLDVAGSFKLVNGTQGANKILTSDATGLTSWQSNDFYRDGAKPNTIMTASGNITFSATNFLTWTNRLIVMGGGRGAAAGMLSTGGYYDISVPPSGTVITTVGGATAITATAAGIPINQWGTLYYKLPSGANTSVAANFIFVGYTADYTVTSDMIQIASYNMDNFSLRMGTGVTLRRNTNSINGSSAIAITAYTSTATAIADANLLAGTMYAVTVGGGAKQLYIK